MFDIKSADEVGVFEVSAKFMGVAMEKVELVFQVSGAMSVLNNFPSTQGRSFRTFFHF